MLFPQTTLSSPGPVVITGAGIVTALGAGWRANADGFRLGRTAFRPVTLFDVSKQRAKTAAEVDLTDLHAAHRLSARAEARLDRAARMLIAAALEAWTQAGWIADMSEQLPVVLGTTSGGMNSGELFYRRSIQPLGTRRGQATQARQYLVAQQGIDLSNALGVDSSVTLIANACASGANAIGQAFDLIRTGRARRALAGGYDALSHLVFAGFDSLQALSTTLCRPFDTHRDGLTLGEGAAVLALECEDDARRRGATILGEVVGYGAATDIHHLTQPQPEGTAAVAAMRRACDQAGIGPQQIDYLNAHGTGTLHNDSSEAAAINTWAGPRASTLPVSSTKADIGHLLGAAGAVEAVVCLMTLQEQWLPPSLGVESIDPACRFQIVRQPTAARVDFALTNSFGFGGANASLILRRRLDP